jgi:hypothetical protein
MNELNWFVSVDELEELVVGVMTQKLMKRLFNLETPDSPYSYESSPERPPEVPIPSISAPPGSYPTPPTGPGGGGGGGGSYTCTGSGNNYTGTIHDCIRGMDSSIIDHNDCPAVDYVCTIVGGWDAYRDALISCLAGQGLTMTEEDPGGNGWENAAIGPTGGSTFGVYDIVQGNLEKSSAQFIDGGCSPWP